MSDESKQEMEIIAKQSPPDEGKFFSSPAQAELMMRHNQQENVFRDRKWQRNLVDTILKRGQRAAYIGGGVVLLLCPLYHFCGGENLEGWQYVAIVGIAAGLFYGIWHLMINSLKKVIS